MVGGDLVLLWFPPSAAAIETSELRTSRSLTLWSSRCVGLGLVAPDNQALRGRFGVSQGELALLLTPSGGEVGRIRGSVALRAVETLIENELDARKRILEDTLDAAKQQRKSSEQASLVLYRQVYSERCLFPAFGKKAARAIRKLGYDVEVDEAWFADDAADPLEPEYSSRIGDRIARSVASGLEAEANLRLSEAQRHYESARALDRGDALPLRYLGELHRHHTGDWEAATAIFEQILAMPADPLSRAVALHGLGKMALNQGELDRGLELLQQSVATFPLALAYRNLAVYWNSEGETAKAWVYAQEALALAPEDTYSQIFAATYFVDQGREDEARQLAQRHGGMLEASYNLAAIWAQLGDSQKALDLLRRHFQEYEQNDAVRAREMKEAREDIVFSNLHDDPQFLRLTALANSVNG